jgi:hypothetical protein
MGQGRAAPGASVGRLVDQPGVKPGPAARTFDVLHDVPPITRSVRCTKDRAMDRRGEGAVQPLAQTRASRDLLPETAHSRTSSSLTDGGSVSSPGSRSGAMCRTAVPFQASAGRPGRPAAGETRVAPPRSAEYCVFCAGPAANNSGLGVVARQGATRAPRQHTPRQTESTAGPVVCNPVSKRVERPSRGNSGRGAPHFGDPLQRASGAG